MLLHYIIIVVSIRRHVKSCFEPAEPTQHVHPVSILAAGLPFANGFLFTFTTNTFSTILNVTIMVVDWSKTVQSVGSSSIGRRFRKPSLLSNPNSHYPNKIPTEKHIVTKATRVGNGVCYRSPAS